MTLHEVEQSIHTLTRHGVTYSRKLSIGRILKRIAFGPLTKLGFSLVAGQSSTSLILPKRRLSTSSKMATVKISLSW